MKGGSNFSKRVGFAGLMIVVLSGVTFAGYKVSHEPKVSPETVAASAVDPKPSAPVAQNNTENKCVGAESGKTILVSISQRKLWACNGTSQAYSSAVITGNTNIISDATPVGSYKIFAKEDSVTLATPSGDEVVQHWFPFLENQYGTFGLRDAYRRSATDFGKINADSDQASRGSIELPLATSTWLGQWATIGTSVVISQ